MQAALGHQHQQTYGLQGHSLATRIGPGDDQSIKVAPQAQVVPHRDIPVQQGVAGVLEPKTPADDLRGHAPHPQGKPRPGKYHIQKDQEAVILGYVLPVGGTVGRKLGQDPLDLLLLLGLQLPQLVIGFHHPHGLNEESAA